jgi:hypothetical protein
MHACIRQGCCFLAATATHQTVCSSNFPALQSARNESRSPTSLFAVATALPASLIAAPTLLSYINNNKNQAQRLINFSVVSIRNGSILLLF